MIDYENRRHVVEIYAERMPFNQVFQVDRDSFDVVNATVRFAMSASLVGNNSYQILHGGAISTAMDIVGSFVVCLELVDALRGTVTRERVFDRLKKLGTIDLRVDYLRPGLGDHFIASGHILRTGNKVAVVRTQLHNDQQHLIAVGTATYLVG